MWEVFGMKYNASEGKEITLACFEHFHASEIKLDNLYLLDLSYRSDWGKITVMHSMFLKYVNYLKW